MRISLGRALLTVCLAVSACNSPPATPAKAVPAAPASAPQPTPRPTTEQLVADSTRTTAGGHRFMAPSGWSCTIDGSLIVVEAPEKDSQVAIVEVTAASAEAATRAAWTRYRPDFKRAIRMSSALPARKGWDERVQYDYATSPNELLAVQATALRTGATWVVVLAHGSEATLERRLAQVGLIFETLEPKGYVRESFAGKKAHPLDATRIKLLGEFIELSRKELGIPGVALGLFDNGKPVFEGGFGVRELGKPQRVDADTLFLGASTTKALTTLLLAKLVDEGKLGWDMPVTKVYPAFKLGSAETTSQVLVKHLVCACTGLPRQDLEALFESEHATPQSSMALLGTMQPTSKFGEVYQYSNLLAAAAGYVGGQLFTPGREIGAAYDDAMRTRIFTPLGMKLTTFDFAQAQRGNHARPHSDGLNGDASVVPMGFNYSLSPIRPAGGAWTSARELLRYIELELRRGKLPDGKQLVSEQNLLERRKKQVALGENGYYGMGLDVSTLWGIQVVSHGGSALGFKTEMLFLPDHGVGAVLLTNADSGRYLTEIFRRRLAEVLFDGKSEAIEDLRMQASERATRNKKERERLLVPPDPAATAKLAAHYHNAALGDIVVKQQAGAPLFDFGGWGSPLASRKNDDGTLSFVGTLFGPFGFEFVVGEAGGKRTLTLRDAQHEYVFSETAK